MLRVDPANAGAEFSQCGGESPEVVALFGGDEGDVLGRAHVAVGDDGEAADDQVIDAVPVECLEDPGRIEPGRLVTHQ